MGHPIPQQPVTLPPILGAIALAHTERWLRDPVPRKLSESQAAHSAYLALPGASRDRAYHLGYAACAMAYAAISHPVGHPELIVPTPPYAYALALLRQADAIPKADTQ